MKIGCDILCTKSLHHVLLYNYLQYVHTIHTHIVTVTHTLSHTHTHTHTHSLSLSLTHTHTHTHTIFSLTYTHTHTHTVSEQQLRWAKAEDNPLFLCLFGRLAELNWMGNELIRRFQDKVNKLKTYLLFEEVCVCERERERESVSVCVRERERERESVCVCECKRESVCVRSVGKTSRPLSLSLPLSSCTAN